jgi:hypothetical protein
MMINAKNDIFYNNNLTVILKYFYNFLNMILNLISIQNPLEYWPMLTTHAINSALVRIYVL